MHYIIGFGGFAMSGKDAAADILVNEHGFAKTYMSAALEQALLALDPVIPNFPRHWNGNWEKVMHRLQLNGFSRYSELHAAVGYDDSKLNVEVRRLLQTLGTEIGRHMFGENVWVDAAFKKVDEMIGSSSVAITGIRFPNELEALHSRAALSVWVERPGIDPVNAHPSDNTLNADNFDVVVKNDGTLLDLGETLTDLLHSLTGYAPKASA